MSTSSAVVQSELVASTGLDGHEYVVRQINLNLADLYEMSEKFARHEIFSDDFPVTKDSFARYVISSGSLWYEIYDLTKDEQVGVIYLTQLLPSEVRNILVGAEFHAELWDSNAKDRIPIGKAAIAALIRLFKIHRLYAQVPMKHGGAIRNLLKLGFIDEGRMRQARAYKGEWYDTMILSILESEVI